MSNTTQTTTTPSKKSSSTQWHAFLQNQETKETFLATAKSQRELKAQLNALGNVEVLSIVKGRAFGIQIKKSFEFITEAEQTPSLN